MFREATGIASATTGMDDIGKYEALEDLGKSGVVCAGGGCLRCVGAKILEISARFPAAHVETSDVP